MVTDKPLAHQFQQDIKHGTDGLLDGNTESHSSHHAWRLYGIVGQELGVPCILMIGYWYGHEYRSKEDFVPTAKYLKYLVLPSAQSTIADFFLVEGLSNLRHRNTVLTVFKTLIHGCLGSKCPPWTHETCQS